MAKQTQDEIADEMYGCDFEDLTAGEKATVTRKFNAQKATRTTATSTPSSRAVPALKVEIGRIGVNGTKTCLMPVGSKVKDLITQSGYGFDTNKEGVLEQSTGNKVDLNDDLKNGEIYVISTEVKSA